MLLVMTCVVVGVGGWWVLSVESLGSLGSGLFIFALWAAKALCDCTGRGRHGNARFSSCGRSELSALLRATVGDQVRRISRLWLLSMPRNANKAILHGDRNICVSDSFSTSDQQYRTIFLDHCIGAQQIGIALLRGSDGHKQPRPHIVQDLRAWHHQQARECSIWQKQEHFGKRLRSKA